MIINNMALAFQIVNTQYSNKELRKIARNNNVPLGRWKSHTIANLLNTQVIQVGTRVRVKH